MGAGAALLCVVACDPVPPSGDLTLFVTPASLTVGDSSTFEDRDCVGVVQFVDVQVRTFEGLPLEGIDVEVCTEIDGVDVLAESPTEREDETPSSPWFDFSEAPAWEVMLTGHPDFFGDAADTVHVDECFPLRGLDEQGCMAGPITTDDGGWARFWTFIDALPDVEGPISLLTIRAGGASRTMMVVQRRR